jgi:photosystem II stability/assembly factor-like uncharacterized protein
MSYVFAGLTDGAVLRSDNDGVTWETVSTLASSINWLAVFQDNLYAAVGGSGTIQRSTDGGENWSTVYSSGIPNPDVFRIWIVNKVLYAAVYDTEDGINSWNGEVVRSTNGATWTGLSMSNHGFYRAEGLDNSGSQLFIAIGCNDDVEFDEAYSQLWGSSNNGLSWSYVGSYPDRSWFGYTHFLNQHWGTGNYWLSYSADASQWNDVSGSEETLDRGTLWDDGTVMYVLTHDRLSRSTDGLTWVDKISANFQGDEICKTQSGALLVAAYGAGGGVYRSTDNGVNWSRVYASAAYAVASPLSLVPTTGAFWSIW